MLSYANEHLNPMICHIDENFENIKAIYSMLPVRCTVEKNPSYAKYSAKRSLPIKAQDYTLVK